MKNKTWSKEEEEYLRENWGTLSVKTIAKNLDRTENAVVVRKCRLGIGSFLECGEYVTWNQFLKAIGISGGSGYKNISWINNREFPIHYKKVYKNRFKIVYLEEWWIWAEKNKDILDFSKFEENMLGSEPKWVKVKRRHDIERSRKYITTPWTKAEDEKLIRLVHKQKHTYDELSKMLRRTNGAISKRLSYLNIKDRPIKADNHIPWRSEEYKKLGKLIKLGYGYDLISEEIGKSSKSIRGKVYQMYLTENLARVNMIMGVGDFGDNRPDRKLKQWNNMNTEERIQAREELVRLLAILQWRFREQINNTEWGEYFQKDMCVNFCKSCLETDGCDTCEDFKKIDPQNCKMCGKTFWEKKGNLYCHNCREMRRKQWLRKRYSLERR